MRTAGQGGRFDATDHQDKMMMDQIVANSSTAVLTEGMGVKPARGWGMRGRETRQYWNKNKWDFHEVLHCFIDTPTWVRGTREMRHVPLELVLLSHDEVSLLLGGGHLPAHLSKASQRVANEVALAGLKSAVLPLIKEYQPTVTTLFFDVNRDLRLEKNRELLKKSVRGTGLKLVALPKPDLGGRKISCFFTDGLKPEAEMLHRIPGYDHRGGLLRVKPDVEEES